MSPEPADILYPLRLVKTEAELEGSLSLASLERLKSVLQKTDNMAKYRLSFGINEQGYQCVDVYLSADLTLTCQRCLGEVTVSVETHNKLAILETQEASNDLPAELEPLILINGKLSLSSLIEDELLLAIPIAPAHETNECPVTIESTELEAEKQNPFAELKQLQVKKQEQQ